MAAEKYSSRALCEFAAYQAAFGLSALFGAGTVPILNKYAKRINTGFNHYLGSLPRLDRKPVIWVHGVSMGESLVAEGFAREIRQLFPDYGILFTSTHPDVIANLGKKKVADQVAYFPLDSLPAMNRAFSRIRPAAIFVAETDFWPAFSYVCARRNVPLVLINGRISAKIEKFYSQAKGLAEIIFTAFTRFLVQSEIDQQRLRNLGVPAAKICITGNMKADLLSAPSSVNLQRVIAWQNKKPLVVFGSLHPTEFELLMPVFKKLAARQIKLLIAPRNLKFCLSWAAKLQNQAITCCLKTEVADNKSQTMLLDTMGELAGAYALADVAMVGGTIDRGVGGHNPLEVMQHQVPLLLGPNTRNFADIVEQLETEDAAKICATAEEFIKAIEVLLNEPGLANSMAQKAFKVLQQNRGALKITIDEAKRIINF